MKMFCMPYAGGNSNIYYDWKKKVHQGIEVVPLEYKGHGKYIMEDFYKNIEDASTDLASVIEKKYDGDYIIFGHSMGAIVAYETVYKLCQKGIPKPKKVIVAGIKPPHLLDKEKKYTSLNKEDFMNEIFNMGGMPKEVYEYEELYELNYEILYADFSMIEKYTFDKNREKLDVPLVVFTGDEDDEAPINMMLQWKNYTNRDFELHVLEGNHFFLFNEEMSFLKTLNNII